MVLKLISILTQQSYTLSRCDGKYQIHLTEFYTHKKVKRATAEFILKWLNISGIICKIICGIYWIARGGVLAVYNIPVPFSSNYSLINLPGKLMRFVPNHHIIHILSLILSSCLLYLQAQPAFCGLSGPSSWL